MYFNVVCVNVAHWFARNPIIQAAGAPSSGNYMYARKDRATKDGVLRRASVKLKGTSRWPLQSTKHHKRLDLLDLTKLDVGTQR
jgi:hypothetical protein